MPPANTPSWVFVTGATAGVGRLLTQRLAAQGRCVIAAARDPGAVEMSQGSGRIEPVRLDLEDPSSVRGAALEVRRITGDAGLSGLVNMAGVIVEGPLEGLPLQALRRQFEVNVVAPLALIQAMLPLLATRRGTIVNIGAVSAYVAPPFYGPIAASKAALAALNDAMRLEFAPLGVRVVLIEPGALQTGIFATARATRDAWLKQQPDVTRRYGPAIEAMEAAFAKSGADKPEILVEAVTGALAGKGGSRSVIGKGAGAFVFLSRLPVALRDRLVLSALGLKRILGTTA